MFLGSFPVMEKPRGELLQTVIERMLGKTLGTTIESEGGMSKSPALPTHGVSAAWIVLPRLIDQKTGLMARRLRPLLFPSTVQHLGVERPPADPRAQTLAP